MASTAYSQNGDFLILMLLVPMMCIARMVLEQIGARVYLSSTAASALKRKTVMKEVKLKKFQESFWKFSFYTFSTIYLYSKFYHEPYIYSPWENFPNQITPKIYWIYMIQIAFYIWTSVCMFWDTRRKDAYQMCAHHFSTVALLIMSYTHRCLHTGICILMIHDISDPFLELAKMLTYMKFDTGGTMSFAVFMFLFYLLRLVIFPLWAFPTAVSGFQVGGDEYFTMMVAGNICVVLLLCLNVFWGVLIGKVLYTKVSGDGLKDNRSDVESD